MRLYEQYRPTTLDGIVGQGKAVSAVKGVMARGVGGNALWIAGPSGTGKTTIARIVARQFADPIFIDEIDAGQLSLPMLAKWENDMAFRAWGKGGRAYIVNEAHGLRAPVIRRLLVTLEAVPAHVVVIFTTTNDGQGELFEDHIDAGPLLSRCLPVKLTPRGLAGPFAKHVQGIAREAGLDGKPIQAYITLAKDSRNNMRSMLSAVAAGTMLS